MRDVSVSFFFQKVHRFVCRGTFRAPSCKHWERQEAAVQGVKWIKLRSVFLEIAKVGFSSNDVLHISTQWMEVLRVGGHLHKSGFDWKLIFYSRIIFSNQVLVLLTSYSSCRNIFSVAPKKHESGRTIGHQNQTRFLDARFKPAELFDCMWLSRKRQQGPHILNWNRIWFVFVLSAWK